MIPPPPRPEAHWPRPLWHASGEDAELLYFVFGRFPADLDIGLPTGITATRYAHADLRQWEGYPLTGALGHTFTDEAPDTLASARATEHVLRIAGRVADPSDLDYLRHTLRAIVRLFDTGAVAVVDPQVSGLFGRSRWIRDVASGNERTLRQHFLVLCEGDPDAPGRKWVHTRGLRKFARPDISLTGVPENEANRAGVLCQQLADMQALGGMFSDGQPLPVDDVGVFLVRPGGTRDDPRFHNTHVAMHWPD